MPPKDPPPGPDFAASQRIAEESLALAEAQWQWLKDEAAKKEANVAAGFAEIKSIFEGREPLYAGLAEQSSALNTPQLERYHNDAQREARFKLAGAGTLGGSAEVDTSRKMAEQMALGLGRVETFAQGQADQLKGQDEGMRNALMGLAASGAVTGQQLGGQARAGLQGLQGTATNMPGLQSTFSDIGTNIGAAARQSSPTYGPVNQRTNPFQASGGY